MNVFLRSCPMKIFTVMVAAFVCLAAFAQGHATYKEKEHIFATVGDGECAGHRLVGGTSLEVHLVGRNLNHRRK